MGVQCVASMELERSCRACVVGRSVVGCLCLLFLFAVPLAGRGLLISRENRSRLSEDTEWE